MKKNIFMICVIEQDHCFVRKSMTSCAKEVRVKLRPEPSPGAGSVLGMAAINRDVFSYWGRGK